MMDLHAYLRAIRRSWWLIALVAVLGAVASSVYVALATPVYAAQVRFYVSAALPDSTSPQSTDLYLQDRATSYANLASSDRLAGLVIQSTGLHLSRGAVAARISGAAELNTVLFTVTVQDQIAGRAEEIAAAVAKQFPVMISDLDKSAVHSQGLALNVVSGPSLNPVPVSPRKKLDVAAGIAAGLLLGLLLAVLRDLLDTAIRSTEQLATVSHRPVLGQVTYDDDARDSPLFVDELHGVRRSEEFRQLRTNIGFLNATAPVQVLVVTSSCETEGKSTTSANLAIVTAETGSRVLLIEADLRRPRMSAFLGLEQASGLSNVLAGQVDVHDVLQTWGGTLSVLASGPVPPNPSELLGSAAMVNLLAEMRAEFDLIIIDTPPLLPVTDAAVVAPYADGAVVVVRYGRTSRHQLVQVLGDLDKAGARVLGTVLNMRPRRGADASSYYGSTYYDTDADMPRLVSATAMPRPAVRGGAHQFRDGTSIRRGAPDQSGRSARRRSRDHNKSLRANG